MAVPMVARPGFELQSKNGINAEDDP